MRASGGSRGRLVVAMSGGVDAFEVVCHDIGSQPVMLAWSLGSREKAALILNFHYSHWKLENKFRVENLAKTMELSSAVKSPESP